MADSDQSKQSDFMIEKIKDRPINKKKLLRRTVITAAMAVIFGLIACLTFLILEPVFSNWLYPEEEPQPVVFPEEVEEMAPEDMLVEEETTPSIEEAVESVISEDEQIQKILDNVEMDKNHYIQLYDAMSDYVAEISASLVTVTARTSDVNWLNDTYESEGQTYGIVIANNGKEYLILTERDTIRQAENITVTFSDGSSVDAVIKQMDSQTNLAVISVSIPDMAETTIEAIKVASLGSSNMKKVVGTPVVAIGCPLGSVGSVGYGMIAAPIGTMNKVDANYKLFTTDIVGCSDASGVLFNMQGQIIGIITTEKSNSDLKNHVTAIGISELRKLIENMSNGKDLTYMGISGMDVTAEANQEMGVPFGAYVKDVDMDSPAMLGGIQPGDVIVRIDGNDINNFSNYTAELLRLETDSTITVVVQRLVQDSYRKMEIEITLGTAK